MYLATHAGRQWWVGTENQWLRNPSCVPWCLTTPNTSSSGWCLSCPRPCQIPLPLLPTIRNADVFPSPTMNALPISWGRSLCFSWFRRKISNSHAQENHTIVWVYWITHSFDLFIIHYSPKTLVNPQRYLICFPICIQLDDLKKLHWTRNKISI